LAGAGVNVSRVEDLRVRGITTQYGPKGGPVGSTPFTGEHTVLRLPRQLTL
jgi:hypothetical protein